MSLKTKGSALVSALILVMTIASICTLWVTQTHYQIKLLHAKEQIQNTAVLSHAIELWAVNQLQTRKIQQTCPIIAKTNEKGLGLPKGWKVKAKLIDAQSVFNINSIVEQNLQLSYYFLLKHLLPKKNVQEVFFSSISWLQNNAKSAIYNAYYAKQTPPYQNSEQMIASLSELNYIKGFTPKIINKLTPFLTALPESTPININTANEEILSILKPALTPDDVKKIIFVRGRKGFKNTVALFEVLESLKIPATNVTINSQYFWLNYELTSPTRQTSRGRCLLYRPLIEKKKFPKQVIIVHQFSI